MVESLRDWAIVVLAALAVVQTLLIIALVLVLLRVTLLIKGKIGPVLDSARDTLGNVQGTSSFVSDTLVKPIIKVTSFTTGVRKALAIITRLSRPKGGKQHG